MRIKPMAIQSASYWSSIYILQHSHHHALVKIRLKLSENTSNHKIMSSKGPPKQRRKICI
jgi:hypothetical protein